LLAVVTALAVGAPVLAQAVGALDRIELSARDARLSIRGHPRAHPDVALVALDSRTISAFGQPPIPRSVHARVLDRLHRDGARVIAYDLRFQNRSPDPRQDRALISAISRDRPVVLATFDPDGTPIPVPAGYSHPARIGAAWASIGVPTDSDGKVRKLFYAPIALPTLPVGAAGLFERHPISESDFKD